MGTGFTVGAIGGLGAGIDVQSFVSLALAGQQSQINLLQQQQSTFTKQTTALQAIQTDFNNLQTAANALSDPNGQVNAQSATSSNPNALSASTDGTATAGVHTISITSLATTAAYYTNALASSSTPLGLGSFQIQVGSNAPVTVNVDSSDNTLDGLAAAINGQNIGVNASVIQDATGARLALVSTTSGAPGNITINPANNTTGLTFTQAVGGANAVLSVDGVPISSTTNTVSNVINGATLNLTAPTGNNPVTLTIAPDTSQATSAINNFVSAYNQTIQDINAQFTVAADGTGGGPLETDGTLRAVQSTLLGAISSSNSSSNGIVNLASLGINLNDDGTLSVDTSALNSALSSNFSGVQSFLQSTAAGSFSTTFSNALTSISDPTQGAVSLDLKGITQSQSDLSSHISDLQAALLVQQTALTATYTQVNDTLQELPLLTSQINSQLGSL